MKRSVRIEECQKTVDIKTPNGKLKYSVELGEDYEPTGDGGRLTVYYVLVRNDEGQPVGNPSRFYSLVDAEKDFGRNVKNYSLLVKAEQRPVDDITVYADKIGYKRIDPDCCLNCEFCNKEYDRCYTAHHGKYGWYSLVCENPNNFTFFQDLMYPSEYGRYMNKNFNRGFHPSMHDPVYDSHCAGHCAPCHGCGGHELAPPHDNPFQPPLPPIHPRYARNPHFFSLEVRPKVDFNGWCKNYKRRVPKSPEDEKTITMAFRDGEPPVYQSDISAQEVIGLSDYIVDVIDEGFDGNLDGYARLNPGGAWDGGGAGG